MFVWVGLIGKLVELILSKIVGKHLDLRLDERKKAAKAFFEFHEALAKLEMVSHDFLKAVHPTVVGEKQRLYRAPFNAIARDADAASRSFVDSFRELHQVIKIYDPKLTLLLSGISHFKQGMLTSSFTEKMKFELLTNPDSVFSIKYSAPSERLMRASLEDTYEAVSQIADQLKTDESFWLREWPEDVLLSLVEENLIEGSIPDNRIAEITQFYEIVEQYTSILTNAREQLAHFLREKFSIEDLLYVSSKVKSSKS
jgi:hypothetical protein